MLSVRVGNCGESGTVTGGLARGNRVAALFKMMKDDAILINVGRGQLVDTNALIRALKGNWIRAAGLDVTDPEPLPGDHELWTMDNVTITPHIGSATEECRTRMMNLASDNLMCVLKGVACDNNVA